MTQFNPVEVAHRFVRSVVQAGDFCVDATVGNGYDTAFLAELVGDRGGVLGLDIQAEALASTEARLVSGNLKARVELLQRGHESLGQILSKREHPKPRLVMFNLGYLPGSDKSITTRPETTLQALDEAVSSIDQGGAISLVVYRGHEGGDREAQAVGSWLGQLPRASFFCIRFERWGSGVRGRTPVFFWIRRLDKGIA